MKVVYTEEAFRDLLDIGAYVAERYPNIALDVEELLRAIVNRIEQWPESAPQVTDRANVHAVALVHYPYNCFIESRKTRSRYSISVTLRVNLAKGAGQGAKITASDNCEARTRRYDADRRIQSAVPSWSR